MKPITLKLSGLQSYREQQEIDFTALCETGLFGIFGPTGSGKSTVLDAITLALYGKVERAQNGTQGILNHSEDAVFVSFSFELLSDEGTHVYRVERRFKRTGDHTVSNSMSRFIECHADGDRVIADKLGDVTRCVEEYIGLKMDDFTRAVVLPQGKFAEFLSLKGSDRRQMLQRLFHLERYGDKLMQKLSQRVKETDNRLERLSAEQTGLGDASAEAVKAAKERLQEAIQEAEQLRQRLQQMNMRAEQLGKVRELIRERSSLQERLQHMDQDEQVIRQLEQQLDAAQSAQSLLPILNEWKQASSRFKQEELRTMQLKQELEQAQDAAAQAAVFEEKAKLELTANEPRLVLRLEQLQQALELQQECADLEKSQKLLHDQLDQINRQLDEVHQQSEHEQMMLSKAEKRREELNIQLKACEVRSQDRRELQEAQQHLTGLDTARKRMNEIEQEHRNYTRAAEEAAAVHKRMEQESLQYQHEEQRLYTTALQLRQRQVWREQQLEQFIQQLNELERQHQQTAQQNESQRLAAVLAAQLQEGEPCTVCGSIHHPSPAVTVMQDHDSSAVHESAEKQAAEQLVQLQQSARQWNDRARTRHFEWNTLIDDWEWKHPSDSFQPQVTAQWDDETEAVSAADSLTAASQQLRIYSEQDQQLERRLQEFKTELRSWRNQQRDWLQQQLLARTEYQSTQRLLDQSAERLHTVRQTLEQHVAQWKQQYPELTEELAREQYANLSIMDEKADQIREGLEKSIPYIEERQKKIRECEQQQNTLERQQIELRTRYEGDKRLLTDRHNRLKQWVGDQAVEELIRQCQLELTHYREQAEQSMNQLRAAQQHQQQAVQSHALAVQAAASLQERAEQAFSQWEQALSASIFDNEDHVRHAYMEEPQIAAGRQRAEHHRQQQRELTLHLREVETKLDGQHITEEEWQLLQTQWQEARQADEAGLELRARATRDFEDIEHRHVRWLELEKQRTELAVEAGHLSKLQASMRGNAFVEYIAEEQLMQVSLAASERLRFLTRQRYSLEVDSGGGFVICDNGNGGIRRPVSTLSGGETFLTSLSLALALSAQIQLRGKYPLQFFFLDEGFGTLDPELLDTVVTSLEKLHTDRLSVGIISHVPELRLRLPRKLVIVPAEQAGKGSRVVLEKM